MMINKSLRSTTQLLKRCTKVNSLTIRNKVITRNFITNVRSNKQENGIKELEIQNEFKEKIIKVPEIQSEFKNSYDIQFLEENDTFLKRWTTFNKLNHNEKLKFSIFTYNHLLRGLSFDTDKFELEAQKLFNNLIQGTLYGIKADLNTYNLMLAFYSRKKHVLKTEEIFNMIIKNKGLKPDLFTFNHMLMVYSNNKNNINKMERLVFNVMQQYNIQPECKTYTILLEACCEAKNLDKANLFRNHMAKYNIIPDIMFYNKLFKLYLICKVDYLIALKLYEDLLKAHIEMDRFTYGFLIETLIQQNQKNKAMELFNKMLEDKIEPNIYVATLLNIDELQLLDYMKDANIQVSSKFYNTLLNHTVKKQDYLTSLKITNNMHKNLLQPTVHSYSILMDTYLILKKPEKCFDLYEEMKHKDIKPDSFIFKSLIIAAGQKENIKLALDYLDQAKENNIPPNSFLFNAAMSVTSKAKNKELTKQLFNRMESEGLNANVYSYNFLLSVFNNTKDFFNAWKVYKIMLSKKIEPNKSTYFYLTSLTINNMDVNKSLQLYYKMQESNYPPSTIFLDRLTKLLHSMNQTDKAIQMFIEYQSSKNPKFNANLINTFLSLCFDTNSFRTATAAINNIIHLIENKKVDTIELTADIFKLYLRLLVNNQLDEEFFIAIGYAEQYFNVKFIRKDLEEFITYFEHDDRFQALLDKLPSNGNVQNIEVN